MIDDILFDFLHMESVDLLVTNSENDNKELCVSRLEHIGYNTGYKFVEKATKEWQRFKDELDIMKFICKEFWSTVFKKQIDNLRTNHMGIYVLLDNRFRFITQMSNSKQYVDQMPKVIPYCDRIHHPIGSGTLIKINGTPHPSVWCFAINLQCGPSVNPRDDIALHLSPVFTPPPRVVRNSLQMQRWGPEESYGGFPFMGGQPFDIMILLDFDHMKIAINGSHFTEFPPCPPSGVPPYQPKPGSYALPVPPAYATGAQYPPQTSYGGPTYPSGGYPPQQYPATGYPGHPATGGYPHSPSSQNKGILGGALGGTLGGLAAGAAASSIGSRILGVGGHHGGHKKHSSPIPIGGLAAGAGAAALGAAVLTGHHPFKKAKKLFKHKGFKHKGWHEPKFGKWKHKGWSSDSS